VGGHFDSGSVITLGVAHAVHDTYTAFLPPLLPSLIAQLGLLKREAGLLAAFLQLPSLSQVFIGYLADSLSLRYLVILAPALTGVMMSLLGIAPGYGFLALLLACAGVSSASLHAVGPVMAGRLSGNKLGRGMGLWMVGGELGRTLGPIIVVGVVGAFGLQRIPYLMAAGFAMSGILYVRMKDIAGGPPGVDRALSLRPALDHLRPILAPLVGLVSVRAFMLTAVTTYLPTFLTEEGSELWFAGISLSLLEAAGIVGALVGGSVSDRLGRRPVLLTSMLLTPVLMGAFLALEGWPRLLILIGLGLAGLSITPVLMALVQEGVPEHRSLANGVYMTLNFALRSIAMVAMGALGDWQGLRFGFLCAAGLMLLGAPLTYFLPKEVPSS
jgi:FSR family fosmidomycin resistance protein-like MFS transporter